MARKPRVVPFVPFPRDGDLDGLVQDGTIWERPKGAYLRFIDTGEIWSEYGQVDRDRVEFVRADGSVWDFTPSFRDTDSSTLGGSLGTLGDDLPSLLESQGMLPRGFLGRSLADESRFDDAVDDVDLLGLDSEASRAEFDTYIANLEKLLSPDAVESGLITKGTQDRLRVLVDIRPQRIKRIDNYVFSHRFMLFQFMEEQLHGKPTGRRGESPSYRYANFTLGESMAALLSDGDRQSINLFRSRLKFLEDEARMRRLPVADMIEIVDEDDVRFLQAMAAALPVTTWHDHHIKELINAYAARDFDKVRYHADWLDRNTARPGQLETHLMLRSQLQYMADNPELLDALFLNTAGLKDYDYEAGFAFRRSSSRIFREVASAKSDLAARRADEATGISSSLGVNPESRLVERAGEHSGKYQDFDVISQVLRDIEIGELEIQRLEADGEHTLAAQFRERLAELRTELKEATKLQDIKVVFDEETLSDPELAGILRFIPGGVENEDLLRKIRKSTDALSPEYRPKEIQIRRLKGNSTGEFNSSTGVLTLNLTTLKLDEHLVIDREAGTIKTFGPRDGIDGVDVPLGIVASEFVIGNLRNDFEAIGSHERPLDQVAVHETFHRLDSLLSADAFFRAKARLELDIEDIKKQIAATPENDPYMSVLTGRLARREAALRELDSDAQSGNYILEIDSPIRLATGEWIKENETWLREYVRQFGLPGGSDHAYVSAILGLTDWDYLNEKYGYSKGTPMIPADIARSMEWTERMEVLAEVTTSHILGRRRIPAGTDEEADSNIPRVLDKYSKQIIPEELKFILTDRDWSADDLPPLTALAGREELDTAYSTDEARRVVRDVDQGKPRGSLLPRVASDPSATSQMLSDAESEDRKHRILDELAQAQVDEPELFRDGVLVDKVWAPFSPPPHLAGSGLRDELAEATSWREVSQLLKGKRVVIFDTETAGRMDPDEVDEDRIVQLGGVVYVDGVIVDRFSMYVNVDYDELSDWSQANLIDADGKPMSPEFLAKQPDMPTVLQEFMRFANGDSDGSDVVFMAHNAAFDLKRMELERQRHDPDGVPSFDLDEVTYFDTMGLGNIVKRAGIEDGPGSASLKKLQEFFGLEDFSWHTADADSEMTGQVLWRLLDYMDENGVPLDGLDPVAGLERQREAFAEYEGKIPEFLRQKERLAELRGLSDQLRSDSDDAVSAMIVDSDRDFPDDPNFGLPPGPDSATEWDRERLATADVIDRYDSPPTSISALDGEGLREDQKSLNRMVAEATTEEDLVPLREALRKAVEDEGSPLYVEAERGSLGDEKTFKVIEALDDLIAFRSSSDESADQQQRIREAEEELALQLRAAIGHHWGDARSEVFHWDFLSERVQTVLGDEFGISIQHERREPPSDFESIRNLQEALAPFVDAWARSQYSATQQYFKDNDIREVNLYRGLFIPRARSSEGPRGTMTDRSVPTARGLQSWTSRLETGLLFLGNQYRTAKDEIKKIEDSGKSLGMPEHVLLHDLVPVELIFGFSVYNHPPSFSFGVSAEQEVVVLGGTSRRVNMLGDDFLDLHREPSGNWTLDRRESTFRLDEDQVFDYLSSDAEITQSVSDDPDFGLPPGPDTPTQWARGRLDKAAIQDSDLPDADLSVVLGDGLREDQKSVSQLLVEASSEDLRELNEAIDAYWKAELVKDLRGRQPWVNLSRQLEELLDKRKETSQREDLALVEQGVMTELQDFINRSWTSARDEVMHWDFMSEIVQNVLGDEFGISVVHERREPPSDVESIQKLQELLTPFVDAWARGQYSATQQYLKDNDITEVNLYRGLFIPTAKGDGRDGIATDRGVGSVRGLQSWTRSLEMALNFAGNRYGTAKNEIAEIEESGEELDLPEHMLLHDVVPAQLIFGIASYGAFDNTGFSFGYGKESEVVVLGSSRPVDILGDDFLRTYQISGDTIPEPPIYIAPSSNPTRSTSYRLSENDLFDYLSSETPNDLDTER